MKRWTCRRRQPELKPGRCIPVMTSLEKTIITFFTFSFLPEVTKNVYFENKVFERSCVIESVKKISLSHDSMHTLHLTESSCLK